ncbi:Ubiquitin carboxyl-terminal hydrolase 37 [Labeo rohita]|uniref:Ubiquitin carboxyl-terminal hydrolase 37 n=1 Tax=Labeo rohita TaxID=84645 RepID=A0ABQ8L7S9_LABRO|nr:Ubiquitin carboxyl-terminal hydrolase 37 [Labeo rohita]
MDKTPKKEKKNKNKKRVKFALCSSVDATDSSSAAPEKCDKPPSSSSTHKRRFQSLWRFFDRMLSFCCVSSSSEQDKTSSVQAQKTSDNNLSAVGRSEKDQKADLLTANQKKEAVRVVADGSSSSAGIRSSEQKPSELPTAIQKSKPVTEQEEVSEEESAEDDDAAAAAADADRAALGALSDLHMSRMDSSDLKKIQLIKVKSCIENHFPDFKGQHQQDAYEFLMACLSCLKKESNALKLSHPTYTCPVSSKEFKLKNERNCSR